MGTRDAYNETDPVPPLRREIVDGRPDAQRRIQRPVGVYVLIGAKPLDPVDRHIDPGPGIRATEAGIDQLRDDRIEILTPRDPDRRGAQLSLRFRGDVDRFFAGLAARGIVGDLRRPDVIRLAPAPIYNTHVDVWHAIEALQSTLAEVRD